MMMTDSVRVAEPRTHLIWSVKWGRWHRRCVDTGGACGYTDDILRAGLFETSTALDYGSEPEINRAVPVAEALKSLRDALDSKRGEVMAAELRLIEFHDAAHAVATTQKGSDNA
jgi:hypothetical protein